MVAPNKDIYYINDNSQIKNYGTTTLVGSNIYSTKYNNSINQDIDLTGVAYKYDERFTNLDTKYHLTIGNVWDISDYGAVSNDTNYASINTAIINSGLSLAKSLSLNAVYLPPGRWYVNGTLTMHKRIGGILQGAGRIVAGDGSSFNPNHGLAGAASQIVYIGPSTGTILHMRGSDQTVRALTLVGDSTDRGILISDQGLGVDYGEGGIGPGKHTIEHISIGGVGIGIQFTQHNENNCDLTQLKDVKFSENVVAIRSMGDQCMGVYAEHIHFDGCRYCFDYLRGGDLYARRISVTRGDGSYGSTLLRLSGQGPNQGDFTLDFVKVDSQLIQIYNSGENSGQKYNPFVGISTLVDRSSIDPLPRVKVRDWQVSSINSGTHVPWTLSNTHANSVDIIIDNIRSSASYFQNTIS